MNFLQNCCTTLTFLIKTSVYNLWISLSFDSIGFSKKKQKEPKYIQMRPRPLLEFHMNHLGSIHGHNQLSSDIFIHKFAPSF